MKVAKKVDLKFFFAHAFRHAGSLFPKQESDLCPLAIEVWSPNHWTAREVPRADLKNSHHKKNNFCNCVKMNVIRLTVVIILQYIQILNHYVTPDANIMLYINYNTVKT